MLSMLMKTNEWSIACLDLIIITKILLKEI